MASYAECPRDGSIMSPLSSNRHGCLVNDGTFDLDGLDDMGLENINWNEYLLDPSYFDCPQDEARMFQNDANTDPVIQDTENPPIVPSVVDTEDFVSPVGAPTPANAVASAAEPAASPAALFADEQINTSADAHAEGSSAFPVIPSSIPLLCGDLTNDCTENTELPPLFHPNCPNTEDILADFQLQSQSNSFRPHSAPAAHAMPLRMDQAFKTIEKDQCFEPPQLNYPLPSNCFLDSPGPYSPGNNLGFHGHPVANMDPYSYQQTSVSYPGSPNQIMDPTFAMTNYQWAGPPNMPRQVRGFTRQPGGGYHPVYMFGAGNNQGYRLNMQMPPTSNPHKRYAAAFNDDEDEGESPDFPGHKRIRKWVETTNMECPRPLNHLLQPHRPLKSSRKAASRLARSMIDSIESSNGDVDLSKAVTVATRRNRNPGRKNTIAQTPAVLKRNEARRQRYRDSLCPRKRAEYDLNASIAKGLIDVSLKEEAKDDEVHPAALAIEA